MKQGIITFYNPRFGAGTIFVNAEERYFFYANKIVAGPQPTVGAEVRFQVSSKIPKTGQLRFAENITILAHPKAEVFTSSVSDALNAGADEVSS